MLMNVFQPKAQLNKPLPNLFFRKVQCQFFLLHNPAMQISALGILHNNADLGLFLVGFFIGNDVRMFDLFHGISFVKDSLILLFVVVAADLLDYVKFFVNF